MILVTEKVTEMELMLNSIFSSELTMTSREIAEVTGKRHDHVKRDVDVMFKELELDAPKFGGYLFRQQKPSTNRVCPR